MARVILFILSGALAVLLTIIGIGLQIAISVRLDHKPTPKNAAAVAATFEFVVLIVLGWLAASRLFWPNKTLSGRRLIIALAS